MPFSILPFRLAYSKFRLAVVSTSADQELLAQQFVDTMSAWHPAFDPGQLGNATYGAAINATYQPFLQTQFKASPLSMPKVPAFADIVKRFTSEAELEKYVRATSYDADWGAANPKIWSAIVFRGGSASDPTAPVEYAIRMNFTTTPSTDAKPVNVLQRAANLGNINNYISSSLSTRGPPFLLDKGDPITLQPMPGFLTLQREVDRFLLARAGAPALPSTAFDDMARVATFLQMSYLTLPIDVADYRVIPKLVGSVMSLKYNNTNAWAALVSGLGGFFASEAYAPNHVDMVPFPVASYKFNTFYDLVLTILSFILVIAYVVPNSRLIRGLVGEKESKMREGMKMMGLGSAALFGSHMLWYALAYHLPVSLIIAAIAKGSYFPNAPFGLTFLLFWLFGVSSTAFMYFLSAFFISAKTASTFCILVFIASYFPIFAFTDTTTAGQKWLAGLLCPTAFGLGINTIGAFESTSNVVQTDISIKNWTLGGSLGIMIFDTILYCLLGTYVDAVLPGSVRGYGVARPWYFCCLPSFWEECCGGAGRRRNNVAPSSGGGGTGGGGGCCKVLPLASQQPSSAASASAQASHPGAAEASFIEEPNAALRALAEEKRVVQLQGLRKEFSTPDGTKVAVESVSLDMYEGQIFVLLGPNGAGKTTAISMLTGLVEPTAGTASFFGADIFANQDAARTSMGVCPQHDVLWPELTVKEHLDTFAAIKGVPPAAVGGEVEKIIREVGLTEKVHVRSSALSGGMKRKLSVAIALIGGSRVVILDEPTSGMDPYSRRSTWNILQNARAGRIILLTTHFMDEADILGDRIAIMGTGKVKCCGSPLFLKKRYGVGYMLVLTRRAGAGGGHASPSSSSPHSPAAASDPSDILAFLKRYVPSASIATSVAAELSVRLPLASSSAFPQMLADLDANLGALGVASYGISVTSIEDVFLRIANQAEHGSLAAGTAGHTPAAAAARTGSTAFDLQNGLPPGTGKAVEIEMPNPVRAPKRLEEWGGDAGAGKIEAVRSAGRAEAKECSIFGRHLGALLRKRAQYAFRDSRAICCQLILPIVLIIAGLGLISSGTKDYYTDYTLSPTDFNTGSSMPPLVPTFTFKAAQGLAPDSASIPALLARSPSGALRPSDAALAASLSFSQARATGTAIPPDWLHPTLPLTSPQLEYQQMSSFLLADRSSFADSKYGALVFTRVNTSVPGQDPATVPPTSPGLSVGIFCNTTALHAPGVWLNALDSALFSAATGKSVRITTHNHPLPRTFLQSQVFNGLLTFSASLIIIIAFSFVAANTALYVVREREVSAKHQQLISGVSVPAYWTANFLFDYLAFCIPASAAIILCKAFNIQDFVSLENDQLTALCLNFYIFGLASTASTYIICFIFKSPSAAQGAVLFINIFSIVLIAASQFLSQLDSTCKAEQSLRYVFALLPSYGFGLNLVTLSFLPTLPLILATCSGPITSKLPPIKALELKGTGAMLIYMFCEFVAYCIIILAIEYVQSRPSLRQWLFPDPQKTEDPAPEDEDVQAEVRRVDLQRQGGLSTLQDTILISHLRKVYPPGKTAVRDLSFGVPAGEVFGFLGINGAGKTTTLQILSGDVLPTSGTASMAGYDILSQQPEVRRLLGYCPQFDSLMELLTVKEHLELFARIKGVPEPEVPAVVRKKIADLDLGAYANKTAGSLSGGNKRKLCVAIALIGDPPLVFLDEPSTGMDPVAKRFMWSVVNRVASEQKLCSIILTTHSMEEVEALCSRIGIMVGGRLRCLGSAQHLKNRHGKAYFVEVRMPSPSEGEVDAAEVACATTHGAGATLTRADLARLAAALGDASAVEEVSEVGSGWALHSTLEKVPGGGGVERRVFAAWWVAELAARRVIRHLLGAPGEVAAFEGSTLTERQGALLRFRVPQTGESLSKMFKIIEDTKSGLGIPFDASLGQVVSGLGKCGGGGGPRCLLRKHSLTLFVPPPTHTNARTH